MSQFLHSIQQDLLDLSRVKSHFITNLQKPTSKKYNEKSISFLLGLCVNQPKKDRVYQTKITFARMERQKFLRGTKL